jgi:hypothetical protein
LIRNAVFGFSRIGFEEKKALLSDDSGDVGPENGIS